ncbi:hypothetical protein EJD97_016793 [Solanum chilense]|uniref:F-box associated beta-propeller type 3 domain-containing protein n=1 Tax=Solanum chilense TaxID=4083 RepID=A0A6N2B706_SOLCI|nr:hypothetical protein EJD97_016793 [Solanum chilense]
MEKLSSETVIDILSRLPIKSLVKFSGDFVFLPKPIRDLGDPKGVVGDENDCWRSSVCIYTIGDDSWRCMGSSPYPLRDRDLSGACVNGTLHWVSSGYDDPKLVDQIVGFDLENEVFGVIPYPDFDSGRLNYTLGVLQSCLSATRHKCQDYVEIWVMKDDGVKESWTKCMKIICDEIGLIIGAVQPLFFQRNGELMLQHGGTLLCYSPLTKTLREPRISGMPRSFEAVVHVGSLVSP